MSSGADEKKMKMKKKTKMARGEAALEQHIARVLACRLCAKMQPPPVSGGAIFSKIIAIGQAPGAKEPVLGRPFAWTAGRTLFGWIHRACGMTETEYRASIYMAAVCRCFPGKTKTGGDRVPDAQEIVNCSRWLDAEFEILRPALVIPIGKLAIAQFVAFNKLTDVIGKKIRATHRGHPFDLVPLPHPSGASPWHRIEPGKTLLENALRHIVTHPAWPRRL
ncbi:MAG TPA: uracil-DNA glycosylase family protein [Chthoniobacteraceae bacterium]|nr:uracil-DNA glycosylase family protein [Chthoniobacteraceae bacterium]